ncbi:hypothetical protein ACJJTC_019447 [Scirpophaga incertulas]
MEWGRVLVFGAVLAGVTGDLTVMRDVTLGFGAALDHCREESGLTEEKMEEFFHFWSENFQFEHRELGCALHCMSRYFNLITDTSRMHHENTERFIKSFPNGEVLAKKLVDVIHTCEKQFDHENDDCWRILHIAECFKVTCQRDDLAPTMEMLLAEFIMEAEA